MLKQDFIIERQGRSFVLYAGLLDLAHTQGLRRVSTKLLQVPSEENGQVAIVAAEVETERGTFSGIGDASPANVSRAMLTAIIRLAETRAKARALRDAVNVGVAALEELSDVDEAEHRPAPPPARVETAPTPIRPAATSQSPAATPAQVAAIYRTGSQAGQSETQIDADVQRVYGAKVAQLSRKQASEVISRLKTLPVVRPHRPLAPAQPA